MPREKICDECGGTGKKGTGYCLICGHFGKIDIDSPPKFPKKRKK